MNKKIINIAVLIPSLNPDKLLVQYINQLIEVGFQNIIIVDDGSEMDTQKYFNQVAKCNEVNVLRHTDNKGKGRALKTGFSFFVNKYNSNEMLGIVTADADGQHSAEDTAKVASQLQNNSKFVLGSRDFSDDKVPWKSRAGNTITSFVFALLYGKRLVDTQTGLRGIPYDSIEECLHLSGEKFDYEILMLIDVVRKKKEIIEQPIQTIYIDSNRATHFHSVRDSLRIYKVIFGMFLRFSFSGLTSFVIDIGLFAFFTKLVFKSFDVTSSVLFATLIARAISSIYNFIMNRTVVFPLGGNREPFVKTFVKYYILCVLQLACSGLLVLIVFNRIHWDTTLLKGFVDLVLFFISYQVQRLWVFRKNKK